MAVVSNDGYFSVSTEVYPETIRVGDQFYVVLDAYHNFDAGRQAFIETFADNALGWSATSQPESDQAISFSYNESQRSVDLEVTIPGTSAYYPTLELSTNLVGYLEEGNKHELILDVGLVSGECVLSGVTLGSNYKSIEQEITGDQKVISSMGDFDGNNDFKLHFNGTENFKVRVWKVSIRDMDTESQIVDIVTRFSTHYFIFDPYRKGLVSPISNRHYAVLYNEDLYSNGNTDNAYVFSMTCEKMCQLVKIGPDNPSHVSPEDLANAMHYERYKDHTRLYYLFKAIKPGILDMIYSFDFRPITENTITSTGLKSFRVEILPKEQFAITGDNAINEDRKGSKVIPRGLNKEVNQIISNEGDVDLEKLNLTVRRSSENMLFVPNSVDWTKERGGS